MLPPHVKEFQRSDRMGAELRRELALILQDTARDPRLGMITIQEVRVSKNLSNAKVFFTCMEADPKACSMLLNKTMAGFLHHELQARIRVRVMPTLHFVHDESVARGSRLSDLILQASRDLGALKP